MIVEYDCEHCGRHVRKRRSSATMPRPPRFCSQACNGAARQGSGTGPMPNHEFACEACGKHCAVYRAPSASQPRFCSIACLGTSQRGAANPSYTGGRLVNTLGYVWILAPDHPDADCRGYMLEHRLVVEREVGRRLRPTEVVHHRNGVRDDNRPENLQLLASQSEHSALHAAERRAA